MGKYNSKGIRIALRIIPISAVLLLACLVFSCKKKPGNDLELDSRIYDLISDYMRKHPQYNTFILKANPSIMREDSFIESGFLLGPGYDKQLKDNTSIYFEIENKRIYYLAEISSILKTKSDHWINTNPPDSIVFRDQDSIASIHKDPWELFIFHAVFFSIDSNKNINVNYRPDTLFTPRRAKTSVCFENIK